VNSKGLVLARALLLSAWLVLTAFSRSSLARAQQAPHEQSYACPKTQVEQALRSLGAYSSGHLPILEGFVAMGKEALDRYRRPYYQYSIQVLPAASGQTLVRVVAKITAWYSDPDPSRSGYRELPSNGRLEDDLLARLDDILRNKPSLSTAGSGIVQPSAKTDPLLPKLPNSTSFRVGDSTPAVSSTSQAIGHRAVVANTIPTESDVEALRKQREALEKRREELNATVRDLEEILRNQTHPNNLAVVREPGTPVLAQPEGHARVLFRAQAEDEFEVLDLQRDWIHVQISGISRGWIRRSQVDLPDALAGLPLMGTNSVSGQMPEPFRVAREETVAFAGDWEPLKGKTVRLFWVQPTLQDEKQTGPSAKLFFAKKILLKVASESAQLPAHVRGLVIVFDSADGGQVAAPLTVLERWKSGALSDAAFWQQISLDPPEAFSNAP
jgi:hypothetical protein